MKNTTQNRLGSQPATIRARHFQPFESRAGVDTVIGLSFPYDPALVSRLKALLEVYRTLSPYRTAGGWLPEHKVWFIEPEAWPAVRDELLWLGFRIQPGEAQP